MVLLFRIFTNHNNDPKNHIYDISFPLEKKQRVIKDPHQPSRVLSKDPLLHHLQQ